ncbi:MAG: indolepyruvate ferredoxin oxidoreductase subunit beta [Candidatus Bathyarchaeota archaeon]|jgi:indolepyruvate ferredoxin oxidoreductase beta subunit|nr:indolepyruvate ferredoxin oxidoreductase subunit beta [Candidatus Bathyarchaeota archaeon]
MKEFNIVIAGVGGQGTLLAAEVLGTAALKEGMNVRVSEIHGMAQRGGAVTSEVRLGDAVLSPTVPDGQADILLGFEPLETLRNLRYASEKTLVIVSDERIPPTELSAKNQPYPSIDEIIKKIHCFTKNAQVVDTRRLTEKAGSSLVQNTVLLGALAANGKLPLEKQSLVEALRELIPTRHVETNVKAFELGYDYAINLNAKRL